MTLQVVGRRAAAALLVLVSLVLLYTAGGSALEVPGPVKAESGGELVLLEGFRAEPVVTGLSAPTTFVALPDGRLLIAEKTGIVRMARPDGTLLPGLVLDLAAEVNDWWDRGLVGVALDPGFEDNGYVYLGWSYEIDRDDPRGPKTARLSRFTLVGDVLDPASERVILGQEVTTTCDRVPPGSDCLPQDGTSHGIGSLHFASDGSLFVALGDATPWEMVDPRAFRAQDVDVLAGKILRVDPSGKGLPTNPFWDGDPDSPRSKVWLYGARNPWRFTFHPDRPDVLYTGDAGWSTSEEISVAQAGDNLGWPCLEGETRPEGYSEMAGCTGIYEGAVAVRPPLLTWLHEGQGAAVTGGVFYTGTTYPERFRGAYFYGDYLRGFIRFVVVDSNDRVVEGPVDFATGVDSPVQIEVGLDGSIWYLSINAGTIYRVVYDG